MRPDTCASVPGSAPHPERLETGPSPLVPDTREPGRALRPHRERAATPAGGVQVPRPRVAVNTGSHRDPGWGRETRAPEGNWGAAVGVSPRLGRQSAAEQVAARGRWAARPGGDGCGARAGHSRPPGLSPVQPPSASFLRSGETEARERKVGPQVAQPGLPEARGCKGTSVIADDVKHCKNFYILLV